MSNDNRVELHDYRNTSTLVAPSRALKRAKKAAGSRGCAGGVRPGELVIFGSRREKVVEALRADGWDVEVVTR